jgi:hypothetical protein
MNFALFVGEARSELPPSQEEMKAAKVVNQGSAPLLARGAGLDRLAWLSGCWKRSTATRTVEEQWMAPRARMMLGMGRTVAAAADSVIEFEQTMIEEIGKGQLKFTANPSGQKRDSFTSIELTDSMVVFENKEHDYPQRVGYRLAADGHLAAWIDGVSQGKARRVDFPYERVTCPGGKP